MKIYVVLVLAFVAITLADDFVDNGQPGCKTEIELKLRYYRNNWNPSQYWECEELGKAGTLVACPVGTGYQNRRLKCVDWEVWRWDKPDILISRPDPE